MGKWLARLIEPKNGIPKERQRFDNKGLMALAVPIILEQFLALLVGLIDTMMISYAGEAAVSGVSLVNQLNNVFIMVFTALAAGGAVVASQYVGRGDKEKGDLSAGQLVMLATVISLAMTSLVLVFGRPLLRLLFGKAEETVLEAGLIYLRISAYSFPFLAIYNGCSALFRSMGDTRTILRVSLVMNAINVVGNAIGVFWLHAGVAGVAYPTLLARAFAAVAMYLYSRREKNIICLRPRAIFAFRREMVGRIFRIAIPNSVENGLFQLSKLVLSAIVALFGTAQIAANGVAQSFWSMDAMFVIAMGPAFITVVGQYMGAGDVEGADYYMRKLLRLTYVGSAVWDFFFLLSTPLILSMYSMSEEIVRLVWQAVLVHNLFNALINPVAGAFGNGLRAAGDVNFTMFASIFATVVCRVSLAFLFCLGFHMGLMGITWAMVIDWAIKASLVIWRYRSGRWKQFKVI